MRRLFVVFVLLAMMLGLRALQGVGGGAGDPLTLATIGFVVLAAFALAELGGQLSLPKITGYILAGVALGPSALGIMSLDVVEQMRMFNTLALGLIATTAGLELDLGGLRKLARTLGATIAVKCITGVVLVGGVVFVLEGHLDSLGLATTAELIGLALVFAALSIGTSPSVSVAVIAETSAKGRLSDLVLGAAIVKDIVVVVAVAIAIAITHAMTGEGGLGGGALVRVAIEIGASAIAGALIGALLIAYSRWIKAEMLLFVAAVVLVVAEVSAALHLELLLVCIVAGVVVRNFSRHEHDLLPPLQTISLPVFIVFFTNAGASVDLTATLSVLPLAAAVVFVRAVGYRLASEIGGRIGGESPLIRRIAWLAYLPQAGVTLGILGLAAAQLGGDIGAAVATLGMAMIAIHLLIGPVTLRLALRRAGETMAEPSSDTDAPEPTVEVAPDEIDPKLAAVIEGLRTATKRRVDRWLRHEAVVRLSAFAKRCEEAIAEIGEVTVVQRSLGQLSASLQQLDAPPGPSLASRLLESLRRLPLEMRVRLEDHHRRIHPTDNRRTRWRKRITNLVDATVRRGHERTRMVPVRLVARTELELRFVELAEFAQNALLRAEASMIAVVDGAAHGSAGPGEAKRDLLQQSRREPIVLAKALDQRLERSIDTAFATLRDVDTPSLPIVRVRYSSIERRVGEALQRLETDADRWSTRVEAMLETVLTASMTALAGKATQLAFEAQIVKPLERAMLAVTTTAAAVDARLEDVGAALRDRDDAILERAVAAVLTPDEAKELRAVVLEARSLPAAAHVVESLMPDVPDRTRLYPSVAELARAERPAAVEPIVARVREHVEGSLHEALVVPIARHVEQIAERVVDDEERVVEAVGVVQLLARSVLESTDAEAEARPLLDAITRERARVAAIASSETDRILELRTAIHAAFEASYGKLSVHVADRNRDPSEGGEDEVIGPYRARSSAFARWWRRLRAAIRGEAARYAERQRTRAAAADHDPADIRAALAERAQMRSQVDGPEIYQRLFSDSPLHDRVLFVAHRPQLEDIVLTGWTWQSDRAAGNGAIVVGGSGSGRSSMVQVAQGRLGIARVCTVEARREGKRSLSDELPRALGCANDRASILAALAPGPTLVVVDDLHSWIDASAEGLAELDAFVDLVDASSAHAFWLVTMHRESFALLEELVGLQGWFARIEHLRAPDVPTLAEVIEARHRPTDLALEFPDSGLAGAFTGSRRIDIAQRYYAELARRSGGSLRTAIRLWRSHAVLRGETVRMRPLTADAAGLPFWPSLGVDELATLRLLLREGPRTHAQIETALGTSPRRTIRLLTTAGLAEDVGGAIDLPPSVRDDIEVGLLAAGVSREATR